MGRLDGKAAIITSYEPTAAAIKGAEVGEGQTEALLKYDVYRRMLADWFGTDPDTAAGRAEEFERQVKEKFVREPAQFLHSLGLFAKALGLQYGDAVALSELLDRALHQSLAPTGAPVRLGCRRDHLPAVRWACLNQ